MEKFLKRLVSVKGKHKKAIEWLTQQQSNSADVESHINNLDIFANLVRNLGIEKIFNENVTSSLNGYVVIMKKEYRNSPRDMETMIMWAELSEAANARSKGGASPALNVRDAILSRSDAAKIRKNAENKIENE